MTETTVGADLLQALEIVTELGVDTVGEDLSVLAVDNVALPVEEPGGDLVLGRGLEDGDDALELFGGELTSTKVGNLVSISSPCEFSPVSICNVSSEAFWSSFCLFDYFCPFFFFFFPFLLSMR